MSQVQRQAITNKSILRRIADAGLEKLEDPRGCQGKRFRYQTLIGLLMFAALGARRSLRQIEELSAELDTKARRFLKLGHRKVSDTTIRQTLGGLDAASMRSCLHAQVKQEHRRGQLQPLDWLPFGVVAIDGKCVGIVEPSDHQAVQNVHPGGRKAYGKMMTHRATLVSSNAGVCIDQRPIPGETNEIGAFEDALNDLFSTYGRTSLFGMVMSDAGNCSESAARKVDSRGYAYCFRIKQNTGEIHREAIRLLGGGAKQDELYEFYAGEREECEPSAIWTAREDGKKITYRLWRYDLEVGFLKWEHARQLIRVERTAWPGEKAKVQSLEIGNRYWVCNLAPQALSEPVHWLWLLKRYWRCENSNHWTCDKFFGEDAKQTPWSKDPEAILVATYFRLLALNILAVLRSMSRRDWHPRVPPWETVLRLVNIILMTGITPKVAAFG